LAGARPAHFTADADPSVHRLAR